jgi:hypothetical protein
VDQFPGGSARLSVIPEDFIEEILDLVMLKSHASRFSVSISRFETFRVISYGKPNSIVSATLF